MKSLLISYLSKALKILAVIAFACLSTGVNAQELQAKVTVNSQRVATTIDKKIFTTLQTQLQNFLNSRKWTKDVYQANEKIECAFLLNIEGAIEPNVYNASLTIQAARPVYNSTYKAALINYMDKNVTFRYTEFQPIEFNESRVQGTDPLVSNLTAVFAYWTNVILGFDYTSFSPKGGEEYFEKARNIVNNAPDNRNIAGWKAFDGQRNRYWLTTNLLDARFNVINDVIYNYYRNGLDKMYEDEAASRTAILDVLTQLQNFNQENPNTMILQFLMEGKAQELINIYKKADPSEKQRASAILSKIDISNTDLYKSSLK